MMLTTVETRPPDPLAGVDYEAAHREGWTPSETVDLTSTPLVQLQALDRETLPSGTATLLPPDRAAWHIVAAGARAGPVLHQDAYKRLSDVEQALIEIVFGPV
ncbi:MAG: hypothetical protein ACRYG8_37645 [Janthinobacterium lividum]